MKKKTRWLVWLPLELALVAVCALETGFLPWLWGAGNAPTMKADPFFTPALTAGGSGLFIYAPEGALRLVALAGAFIWGKTLAGFAWRRWGPKA